MPEKTTWTPQIDLLLCDLYEKDQVLEWGRVSERIQESFPKFNRNGKQCRERYKNIAKFKGSTLEWLPEHLEILYSQFISKGPKWVELTKALPGRSHNSIKNKFNAELRKEFRKLNSARVRLLSRHGKPIDNQWFAKIIKLAFPSATTPSEVRPQALRVIKELLSVMFLKNNQLNQSQQNQISVQLLQTIREFNRNYLFLKRAPGENGESAITKMAINFKQQDFRRPKSLELQPKIDSFVDKIEDQVQMPSQKWGEDGNLQRPIEVEVQQNLNDSMLELQDLSMEKEMGNKRKNSIDWGYNYFESSA